MAGRQRKCKICGEWITDNNDSLKYKNGYAHKGCFNIAMKVTVSNKKEALRTKKKTTSATKPQKELKDGLSEEEYKDKCMLCDYIRSLTHEDVTVVTYKLIEDYKRDYGITYREMYDDLYWYFCLCNNDVKSDKVIGMVPYCHSDAQRYYRSIQKSNVSCREHLNNLSEMYKETSAPVSDRRGESYPQIDIEAFLGED